jgi:tRNA(Arg) A34 adenosine deaminase TadA
VHHLKPGGDCVPAAVNIKNLRLLGTPCVVCYALNIMLTINRVYFASQH